MSKKHGWRRWQQHKTCRRKTKRMYDDAVLAALQAIEQTGELITPYECPSCYWWHIGHPGKGDEYYGETL